MNALLTPLREPRKTVRLVTGLAFVAAMFGATLNTPNQVEAAGETPTTGCSSVPVTKKADGSKWVCTFDDEFAGTALKRGLWTPVPTNKSSVGETFNKTCFMDSTNNIKVSGGTLSLISRQEASTRACMLPNGSSFQSKYTGGWVSSYKSFKQAYGRFEIRAKFPATKTPGVQGALWLFPAAPTYGAWPASGEIDIAEYYSRYPDRAIPYIHYNQDDSNTSPVTNNYCYLTDPSAWHTYTAEWSPTTIKIWYDSKLCLSHTIKAKGLSGAAPFDKPFDIDLTQTLSIPGGSNTFVEGKTKLPASTIVDYVRVWK